jgi:hypothetical protein
VAHWSRARSQWFVEESRGALVLLALWPFALLFPAAVTFGLGQVFERLEVAISEWLLDTPFIDWMPLRQFELEPLVPAVELLCVMLGALVPCLLSFLVARTVVQACRAAAADLAGGHRHLGAVGGAELRARARLGMAGLAGHRSACDRRVHDGRCCSWPRRAACAPPCC